MKVIGAEVVRYVQIETEEFDTIRVWENLSVDVWSNDDMYWTNFDLTADPDLFAEIKEIASKAFGESK